MGTSTGATPSTTKGPPIQWTKITGLKTTATPRLQLTTTTTQQTPQPNLRTKPPRPNTSLSGLTPILITPKDMQRPTIPVKPTRLPLPLTRVSKMPTVRRPAASTRMTTATPAPIGAALITTLSISVKRIFVFYYNINKNTF